MKPRDPDQRQRQGAGARTGLLLLLAASAVVLAWAPFWWSYTIDDAYISLRYAHHLALGEGLVFNPGERVEGSSAPGWVFTLALVEWLGGAPLAAAKGLGSACALALVFLLYAVLRRSDVSPLVAGLAALWLAVAPGLHVYGASGMETLPFALAVAAAVAIPTLVPAPVSRCVLLPLGLLAVATLRPEGLLVLALLVPLALLQEDERSVKSGVLVALAAVAALLLARHAYYGEWLPNTYLAKPSPLLHSLREQSSFAALRTLLESLRSSPSLHGPIGSLGGPLLCLGILLALLLARARTARAFGPAAAVGLAGVSFMLYAPRDWMPADRFALPFAFPLVLLAALGMDALLRATPPLVSRGLAAALVLVVLGGSAWPLLETRELLEAHRRGAINAALDARELEAIGRWLAANADPADSVLAYEVGAVGYFSGLRIVDHEGLVHSGVARVIARAGGYGHVRTGRDAAALRDVVQLCTRRPTEWFLLRTRKPGPWTPGTAVPPGSAQEVIQNALLDELRSSTVVAKAFPMNGRRGPGTEWYLLLRRARDAAGGPSLTGKERGG